MANKFNMPKITVIASLIISSCLLSGCPKAKLPSFGKTKTNPLLGVATIATFHEGQQAYMDKEYTIAARKMGVYAESYPNTVRGLEANIGKQ